MPAIHRTNLSTLKVLELVYESTAHATCLFTVSEALKAKDHVSLA